MHRVGKPYTTTSFIEESLANVDADKWVRANILADVPRLEAGVAGGTVKSSTVEKFAQDLFKVSEGKVLVIQNINFESRMLGPHITDEMWRDVAENKLYRASADYKSLKSIPKQTEELLSKAYKSGKAADWWNVYKGKGGKGGLRWALEETTAHGRTISVDLMDITKGMMAGLQKHNKFSGDFHTGSAIDILVNALNKRGEAHTAIGDAFDQKDVFAKHVDIAEKVYYAEKNNINLGDILHPDESRYIQRLENVNEWYKASQTRKSFAKHKLDIIEGRGVPLTRGVIQDIDKAVFEKGVLHTKETMSGLPKRVSSQMLKGVQEAGSLSGDLAHRRQYEAVMETWLAKQQSELKPVFRTVAEDIWKITDNKLLKEIAETSLTSADILARMESTGARVAGTFKDDAAALAGSTARKFSQTLSKLPTNAKYAIGAILGLGAIGALIGGSADSQIERAQRTPSYPYSPIEGIRQRDSVYNTIAGMYSGYLPHNQLTDFGSGREQYNVKSTVAAVAMSTPRNPPIKGHAVEFQQPNRVSKPVPGGSLMRTKSLSPPMEAQEPSRRELPEAVNLGSLYKTPGLGDTARLNVASSHPITKPNHSRMTTNPTKQALEPHNPNTQNALTRGRLAKQYMTKKKAADKTAQASSSFIRKPGYHTPLREGMTDFNDYGYSGTKVSLSEAANSLEGRPGYHTPLREGMTDFCDFGYKGTRVSLSEASILSSTKRAKHYNSKDFAGPVEAAKRFNQQVPLAVRSAIQEDVGSSAVATANNRLHSFNKAKLNIPTAFKIFGKAEDVKEGSPVTADPAAFYNTKLTKKDKSVDSDLLSAVNSRYSGINSSPPGEEMTDKVYHSNLAGMVTRMETKKHMYSDPVRRTGHLFKDSGMEYRTRGRSKPSRRVHM